MSERNLWTAHDQRRYEWLLPHLRECQDCTDDVACPTLQAHVDEPTVDGERVCQHIAQPARGAISMNGEHSRVNVFPPHRVGLWRVRAVPYLKKEADFFARWRAAKTRAPAQPTPARAPLGTGGGA